MASSKQDRAKICFVGHVWTVQKEAMTKLRPKIILSSDTVCVLKTTIFC